MQIDFRTALTSKILVRLQHEPVARWSVKTSVLIASIVDQIFSGLVRDADLLRAVLLSALEEHLSERQHDASPTESLLILQGSLNRLILFA